MAEGADQYPHLVVLRQAGGVRRHPKVAVQRIAEEGISGEVAVGADRIGTTAARVRDGVVPEDVAHEFDPAVGGAERRGEQVGAGEDGARDDNDGTVPLEWSLDLCERLQAAGKTYSIWVEVEYLEKVSQQEEL